jgi:DNA (cytosine-5)-methyltransferase 1
MERKVERMNEFKPQPTVESIYRRKKNGFKAVSTFSGCGGASLGLRMAGFEVLFASEFVEAARETYLANHKTPNVDGRDIRTVSASEILETIGLARGELDLLEGSPPCSAFSRAGKGAKGWGESKKYSDTEQRADDLFFEFSRLVGGIYPKMFLAENVPGLITGQAKGYFNIIKSDLESKGYKVRSAVLNAARYGVPQSRKRLIFVGIREDLLNDRFTYPAATVLRPVPVVEAINLFGPTETKADLPDIELVGPSIEKYAIYEQWKETPVGRNHPKRFSLTKPNPKRPAPTITQTAGSVGAASIVHPYEPRKFSVLELKRLGGFPDDFKLTGDYSQRVERIGRAVPPPLYEAVGREIAKTLKQNER